MKSKIIFLSDPAYSDLLRNIYDPPKELNIWGEFPNFNEHPPIAIVGSRKPTDYGRQNAHDIAGALAKAGFTIISGLAYGIDSAAHRACLEAGGVTLAILGSGLDKIYPDSHKELAEEIVKKGGAVISEFKDGTPPLAYNFPIRNRIVTGMSLGVIVIEAAADSGSLISARLAMEQGREVFAVPGAIGNINTAGTHRLIREGAALIESAQDVIDILDARLSAAWKTKFSGQSFGIGDRERKLLNFLTNAPQQMDELIEKTGFKANEAASMLTMLEISGLIREADGRGYIKLKTHD